MVTPNTHTLSLSLPLQEFEYWLKRNPKILDSLLSFKTKDCTLGPLIMSPSEQLLSAPQETTPTAEEVPLVVTMKAASPTLFQVGEPDGGDVVGEQDGSLERDDKEDLSTSLTEQEVGEGNGTTRDPGTEVVNDSTSASSEQPPSLPQQDIEERALVGDQEGTDDITGASDDITIVSEDSTDQPGSIMLAESNLSIDMSCVAKATSSDKLGSPVLPTTALEEITMTTEQQESSSSLLLATSKPLEEESEPVDESPPTFVVGDLERVEEELEGVHLTPSISESVPDVTIDLEEGVEPVFSDEEVPGSLETVSLVNEVPEPMADQLADAELEVAEAIYTAWVPSAKTQELLNQSQPTKDPSHLTCPALVADVRMVSSMFLCSLL